MSHEFTHGIPDVPQNISDRIGARTVSFRPGIPSQHIFKTRAQHPVAIDRRHFYDLSGDMSVSLLCPTYGVVHFMFLWL